jgi:hypothetical protein
MQDLTPVSDPGLNARPDPGLRRSLCKRSIELGMTGDDSEE